MACVLQCLAVIFVLFWIEGHNSAPYKVGKGEANMMLVDWLGRRSMQAMNSSLIKRKCCTVGSVEGVVLDAPFWRVHWYKILALLACSAVNVVSAWTPHDGVLSFYQAST